MKTTKQNQIIPQGVPCDGSCDVHHGNVVSVTIEGVGWGKMNFNYCQEAIAEDIRRGFIVTPDNNNPPHKLITTTP